MSLQLSVTSAESPEKTLQPWIIVVIASSVIVLSLLVVIIALAVSIPVNSFLFNIKDKICWATFSGKSL